MRKDNKGYSLLELIVVISIMAVIVSIVAVQFVKYIERSRRAKDITNADRIATVIQTAFASDPDAYDAYLNYGNSTVKKTFTATVDGVTETYDAYLVMVNEKNQNYRFGGGMNEFKDKGGKPGLYTKLNNELGLTATGDNTFINPKAKIKKSGKSQINRDYGEICCWRILKRVDNGQMEIWAADSIAWGGWPVYRVWPVPDDVYTKN